MSTPPNLAPPEPGLRRLKDSNGNEGEFEGDLIARVKRHFDEGIGAFDENRRLHAEDLNFIYNSETQSQWDPMVLAARRGKPCYTFNRVIGPVNLVNADMRQTRPAVKVRPTTESASEAVAQILGDLWRSIEDESRASEIYKSQFKFCVGGGFGALGLRPVYADGDTFDQVLRVRDIPNPQTVIWDPECNDPCCGDANWCIVGERISHEKYRIEFPNAGNPGDSFNFSRDSYGWYTDHEVRVVEYYERVPFVKTIALMSDGSVIPWSAAEAAAETHLDDGAVGANKARRMVKTRDVLEYRVMWAKCDGSKVLEGPYFYKWQRIPIVRMPGRYINIEGRKKLQSLIRHSKDAQRTYNTRVNDMIERAALVPKAPYLVTQTMIKGYEKEWQQANNASRPFLPYNVDPEAAKAGVQGGAPARTPPIDLPQGAIALAQSAAQDIQATTGFFDPALGNADDMNRVSGKALVQHTRRSDLGSYEFVDGFGACLQLLVEMAIDMIPTIYDGKRVVRTVGVDEVEKLVQVNHPQEGTSDLLNDLRKGSYACKVTLGPSYQTARQEQLDTMIQTAATVPGVAQICADLIAKNIDTPDSDEMVRRLRIPLIRQGVVQPTQVEKAEIAAMPNQQPNPLQQLQMQLLAAKAKGAQANAAVAAGKAQGAPLHLQRMVIETAGKELANRLLAQKLGQPAEAGQVEGQLAGQGNAPPAGGAQ